MMSCSALYYTQNTLKLTYVEAYNDISFFINMCVCMHVWYCACVYMCAHAYMNIGYLP